MKEFRDKNNKLQEEREAQRQIELRDRNKHDLEKRKAARERDEQKRAVFVEDRAKYKQECDDLIAQATAVRKRVRQTFQGFEDRDRLVASVYKSVGQVASEEIVNKETIPNAQHTTRLPGCNRVLISCF